MAAIPLGQANRGYITLAPPWSKRMFKLGRLANPPGRIPEALGPYMATGTNPNLVKAQAVVQANVVNPPGVRARALAKAKARPKRAKLRWGGASRT